LGIYPVHVRAVALPVELQHTGQANGIGGVVGEGHIAGSGAVGKAEEEGLLGIVEIEPGRVTSGTAPEEEERILRAEHAIAVREQDRHGATAPEEVEPSGVHAAPFGHELEYARPSHDCNAIGARAQAQYRLLYGKGYALPLLWLGFCTGCEPGVMLRVEEPQKLLLLWHPPASYRLRERAAEG